MSKSKIIDCLSIDASIPDWVLRTYDSATSDAALKVDIDATHSGRITNRRTYPSKVMKKARDSWVSTANGGTSGYDKPVIVNHDLSTPAIGRVLDAKFIALKRGEELDKDYLNPDVRGQGSGLMRLSTLIADKDAIARILDGRYQTVSTGAMVDQYQCSVCNKDMHPWNMYGFPPSDEDACQHIPGKTYTIKSEDKSIKKLCFAITRDLDYKEVSFVNLPADEFAKVASKPISKDSGDSDELVICDYEDNASTALHSFRIYDTEGFEIKPLKDKKAMAVVEKTNKKITSLEVTEDLNSNSSTEVDQTTVVIDEKAAKTDSIDADARESKNGGIESSNLKTDNKRSTNMTKTVELPVDQANSVFSALTSANNTLNGQITQKDEQIAKLNADLASKQETVASLHDSIAKSNAKSAKALATVFVAYSTLSKRKYADSVKDQKTFTEAVEKFATRSIDSLENAIIDMADEVLESLFAKAKSVDAAGIVAEKRVEQPNQLTNNNQPQDLQSLLKTFLSNKTDS